MSSSDVTKALDAETEAKTESGGFETEAEAVAPRDRDRGSIPRDRGTRQLDCE